MIPRIYLPEDSASLDEGAVIALSPEQGHYLRNVLRRAVGEAVLVFNGRDGEYLATVAELSKKTASVTLSRRTRALEVSPDLTLLFAPVKRAAIETIVQKATELGVRLLAPVITERTSAPPINIDRLGAIAIEAAEQCERLAPPDIVAPRPLAAVLTDWPPARPLYFADEAGDDPDLARGAPWGGPAGRARPLADALAFNGAGVEAGAGVLIGPEGGFSPAERARLHAHAFVTPITLGPRILRADTAAIAALAIWQAFVGDWRGNEISRLGGDDWDV